MASISKELAALRQEKSHSADILSMSDGTQTPDSTASSARTRHVTSNPAAVLSREGLTSTPDLLDYNWPLKLPYLKKLDSLRGYFVCLAQALSYIHESDVRHKDIKPENILIDSSGSIVVTDFGISRSFPKQAPHVTNDKWEWTRKYASPEIMKGKRVPRDDPSDVFSLGCVFLEIATLVLGKSLHDFSAYYATQKNDTGVEDAYHCNLDRVHEWIDGLGGPSHKDTKLEQTLEHSLTSEQIDSHDFIPEPTEPADPEGKMIGALAAIRQMLDETPTSRPKAKGLWGKFQWVSDDKCRDCDPRHPEVWIPSAVQKQKLEEGTNNRRSMHLIPEENLPDRSYLNVDGRAFFSGIDSTFLSAQDMRRSRRSSSPHIHKRVGGAPMSVVNGQPMPPRAPQRASSPDNRWHFVNTRGSTTTSPRPASPTTSALGLTKTTSHPRAASPQNGPTIGTMHHAQSSILNNVPSATQSPSASNRNFTTPIPSSPKAGRHPLKSNSGDLPEKQALKATSNGAVQQNEDKVPDATDVIIYDYSGEHVYVAPYIALRGT